MANRTTYHAGRHNGHSDLDEHAGSQQIREHIEHTRREMDETLEEIGERLHPKHLLDYALDYVRSTSARATAEDAGVRLRSVCNQMSTKVKDHPMPAALITAGLLWWLFERDDDDSRSRGSLESARRWYGGENTRYTRQHVPAWHPDFDWSQADEDQETWTQKAKSAMESIRSSLSDTTTSAVEKLRGVSSSLVDLSGHRREKLHTQWADLNEHSGSVVDARTGEPYDDSYGEEWRNLHAAHCVANCKDEEAESWRDKASHVVEGLRESLGKSGDNVQGAFQSMSSKVGQFAGSIGGFSSQLGHKASEGATAMWERTASGTRRVSESARDMSSRAHERLGRAQDRLGDGYRQSRDYLSNEMHEHPLAVGAAAIALGMLVGFVLPRTESEDRMMGEAADDVKEQVKDRAASVANDAIERGQEVAQAAGEAVKDEARKQGLTPEHV
jgi:ElaB/YqjD/DUF883 family membrane-anchored ribosome-binding protein